MLDLLMFPCKKGYFLLEKVYLRAKNKDQSARNEEEYMRPPPLFEMRSEFCTTIQCWV